MKRETITRYDLVDEINDLRKHINNILEEKHKERYFEAIALLYSFFEDLLKWLVFIQIMWNKSKKMEFMSDDEFLWLKKYCNQLTFFASLNVGLAVGLLYYSLFMKLNIIRNERNRLIHQYWLYIHKGKTNILKKKLEKLAGTASTLVGKLNQLIEETKMDRSYGLFEIKGGKNLIT